MTADSQYTPPPPPPPAAPSRTIDFGKSFTFVFEDPGWLPKILIGGLFYLAGFLIIGHFFILGYMARLVRNVVSGVERPLPDWSDLGTYFADGIKLFFVAVVYIVPFVAIIMLFAFPTALLESTDYDQIASAISGTLICFTVPLMLVVVAVLPVALLRVIMTDRFSAGFEFGAIYEFIRDNFMNYLLAVMTHIVANFIAQFGIIACCIGVVFTGFWSMAVTTYAFAQAYRLGPK